MLSNAEDMAVWLKFLLHNWNISQPPVTDGAGFALWSQVIKDTWKPVQVISEDSFTAKYRKPNSPESYVFNEYGLGWRIGYYRG